MVYEHSLQKYINKLLKNQNNTNTPFLQNIYTRKDYYTLLQEVTTIIEQNPHASLQTIKYLLFQKSGLKELIDEFIHTTEITPGLLLDFGTLKNRDTVLCGLSQEYSHEQNGVKTYSPKIMNQDTIFDLASTSKLFTCIAILKLKELGLIDLFSPVRKYLPEFKHLDNTTIYDLLKFRVKVSTKRRIDKAKSTQEALEILYTAAPDENQNFTNAYTDIGAMILRLLVEKITKIPFNDFLQDIIFKKANMKDTHLNVPFEKIPRVANENYATIINSDGTSYTKFDTNPGTAHDPKALIMGANKGIAPGHAGYFSTMQDMVNLGFALTNGTILTKESVFSIADNEVGRKIDDKFTTFYGSLTFLKQPDNKNIYLPLSGKSFISPGFAGTTLCIDPLNNIVLFIGANRLHNRVYQIHPSQIKNIKIDETGKKTFTLSDGEEMIVCSDFTQERTKLLKLAINLSLQYQFLEHLFPSPKAMHLVRELN